MKLKSPRLTLIAGLALALNLNGGSQSHGAGVAAPKVIQLAKAQSAPSPAPAPVPGAIDAGAPTLSTTPLTPVPEIPQSTTEAPATNGSGVMTAPLQLGSPPALAPTNRPPMGLFYGEQERLDALSNPSARPLVPVPYTNTAPSGSQYPLGITPGLNGGIGDGSGINGAPLEMTPHLGNVDRFGYAPPPGTLGQTYKRRSRPLDENKHPRVGIVEVNLPEGVDVTAKGLKSKWTGKVWRLESDSLIPGVPHIFEIKASWGEGTQPQVRHVRLIMGRIVDLDF
jgi:hypothetical protein